MRTVVVLAALLLAGCSTQPVRPVPAQCNPLCLLPCTGANGDTGVRWEAEPTDPDAWDVLAGEVIPSLVERERVCEVRRNACAQCLQRLDKAGVIKL